jgi:hypothetical protein
MNLDWGSLIFDLERKEHELRKKLFIQTPFSSDDSCKNDLLQEKLPYLTRCLNLRSSFAIAGT